MDKFRLVLIVTLSCTIAVQFLNLQLKMNKALRSLRINRHNCTHSRFLIN